MRSAVRMKRLAVPAKPLLIALTVMTAVWAVARFDAASAVASVLSRGLSGEAALAILHAETAPDALRPPGYGTLLSFGSPLLASVKPGESGKTPGQGSIMPAQVEPQPPNLPEMTPMLPMPSEPPPETEPSSGPSPDFDGFWDDRVWPMPDEGDPGARPLREVTLLPIAADGSYLTDGSVTVNNDSPYTIDVPALLARAPAQKASDGPQILIIHTHASESFLPDERDFYIPTDIERTEDVRYNVVRVGDEITERLEALGLTVLHDRNINDYPTYSGSYNRTLRAIEGYIKEYPTIQAVLDIHRDSVTSKDGTMFKTVCESANYGKTAQMMFVVGTSGTGLPHDGWRDNLAFAAQIQSRILEACPTAMRPIHLRKERFNQHATPGSLILEVGTAANSLTEALRAANLFCDAAGPYLAEILLP